MDAEIKHHYGKPLQTHISKYFVLLLRQTKRSQILPVQSFIRLEYDAEFCNLLCVRFQKEILCASEPHRQSTEQTHMTTKPSVGTRLWHFLSFTFTLVKWCTLIHTNV